MITVNDNEIVTAEIRASEIDRLSKNRTVVSLATELYRDGALIDWHDPEFTAAAMRQYKRVSGHSAPAPATDFRDALQAAWLRLKGEAFAAL